VIRWILLGLAGFLVILLVRLPAGWFSGQLPPQIRCDGLGGSVWRGDCEGLAIDQGMPNRAPLRIDSLHWKLHPAALLLGRLSADVVMLRGEGEARATVTRGAGGLLDVQGLQGQMQIDRDLLPPLPPGWRGVARFEEVQLRLDGSTIGQLSGAAELRDMTDATAARLGSYRLDFGTQPQSPPFHGTFRSLDGPLTMEGRITLEADTSWVLEGTVAARPDTPPALARMLQVLGPADASGARPFSIAGAR
jgi:hypothetical protein